MSEQTATVRTDELRPGDRVWHPFDIVCFTVAHKPEPVALDFEGERGLRVTGTDDRGETVHVDVAPGYRWHRGPVAVRSAPQGPQERPRTLLDLARNALNARMAKDALRHVLGNVIDYAARLEAERHTTNEALSDAAEQLRANRDRIAGLEAEREKLIRWHDEDSKTINRLVARVERRQAELVALRNDALNMRGSMAPADGDRKVPFQLGETLTPAVDWLIARVAEMEERLAEYERPVDEDPIAYALTGKAETGGV